MKHSYRNTIPLTTNEVEDLRGPLVRLIQHYEKVHRQAVLEIEDLRGRTVTRSGSIRISQLTQERDFFMVTLQKLIEGLDGLNNVSRDTLASEPTKKAKRKK